MKKYILSLIVCMFCGIAAHAEKEVGRYSLSYFNKSYSIEASDIKNGKFSIYIQVSAERPSKQAMISVESDDLEELTRSLLLMKDKFTEWSKTAKENNVTELSKEMDINFPLTTICWYGTKWWFSFRQKLKPMFLILDDGRYVVTIYKKVHASSNQYIDEKIYWVFSDSKEIDDLVSELNVSKIKTKLQTTEKASELFK